MYVIRFVAGVIMVDRCCGCNFRYFIAWSFAGETLSWEICTNYSTQSWYLIWLKNFASKFNADKQKNSFKRLLLQGNPWQTASWHTAWTWHEVRNIGWSGFSIIKGPLFANFLGDLFRSVRLRKFQGKKTEAEPSRTILWVARMTFWMAYEAHCTQAIVLDIEENCIQKKNAWTWKRVVARKKVQRKSRTAFDCQLDIWVPFFDQEFIQCGSIVCRNVVCFHDNLQTQQIFAGSAQE